MKLVLRVIGKDSGWFDLPNPFNSIPSKGDHIVYNGQSYLVSYLEYDYDGEGTVYICCLNN